MGDRIAVMESGRMLQEGTPAELYEQPSSLAVARFLGDMNLMQARIETQHGDELRLVTAAGTLHTQRTRTLSSPDTATLGFRPEDATLHADAADSAAARNGLHATVAARHYLGQAQLYQLDAAGTALQVHAPKHVVFEPGSRVFVHIERERCMLFDTPPSPAQP